MNPGSELSMQLLRRAYCYLRLSGVAPSTALEGMRTSMNVLAEADQAQVDRGQALWRYLETLTAQQPTFVPSAPPLLRGHMHYPEKARSRP